MSTSVEIDYAQLKKRITFEQVLGMLGTHVVRRTETQLVARCPICKSNTLKITPSKGLCNCFKQPTGSCAAHGDIIGLVAAVKGYTGSKAVIMRQAAENIVGHFGSGKQTRATVPNSSPQRSPEKAAEPKPLSYLVHSEEVEGLGLSEETCSAFGAGYAPRGLMVGRLAIVLRDRQGRYIVNAAGKVQYVGIAMKEDQAPRLKFADDFDPRCAIFNAHKAVESQDFVDTKQLILVVDPLEVLIAHERRSENVISFLTSGWSPEQLTILLSLMDESGCETIETF
jgi:hypothetical protein